MTQKQQGGTAQWNVLPNAPNDSHLHELIRVLGIALVGQVTDEELIAVGGQPDCQDAYYTLKAMKKRNESNHRVLVKELLKDRNQACHGNLLSRDTVNVYWAFVNTVRLCAMLGSPPSNFINTFNLGKLIWLSALQPNDLEKLKSAGVDLQRQFKFTLFVDEEQEKAKSPEKSNSSNSDNTEAKEKKEKKLPVLCKFGASCANKACTFLHRSLTQEEKAKEPCKLGSACQFQGCLYAHPSAPSHVKPFVSKLIQCKFGGACTRPECSFGHSDRDKKPKLTQPSPPLQQPQQPQQQQPAPQQQPPQQKKSKPPHCKFGINCTRQDSCTFYHPSFTAPTKPPKDKSKSSSDSSSRSFTSKATNSSSASSPVSATAECKFGAQCKREDCKFSHPIPVTSTASFAGKATSSSSTSSFSNPQAGRGDCKFGAQCTRSDCHFTHPPKIPSFAKNEIEKKACKFGSNCTKKDCAFLHK